MRLIAMLLLCCCAVLYARGGAAAEVEVPRTAFAYAATLDADGRVLALQPAATAATPEALPEAIDAAVREQLLAREYRVDAALAAPVHTWLQGMFELREADADYRLHLVELRAGPRLAGVRPPRYPAPLIRRREGGDFVLTIAVAADGSAQLTDMEVLDRIERDSQQAVRTELDQRVAEWRFEPERDARGALASTLRMLVQLRLGKPEPEAHDWRTPPVAQVGRVRVPDADFVPLPIRVTGSRVKRSGGLF